MIHIATLYLLDVSMRRNCASERVAACSVFESTNLGRAISGSQPTRLFTTPMEPLFAVMASFCAVILSGGLLTFESCPCGYVVSVRPIGRGPAHSHSSNQLLQAIIGARLSRFRSFPSGPAGRPAAAFEWLWYSRMALRVVLASGDRRLD